MKKITTKTESVSESKDTTDLVSRMAEASELANDPAIVKEVTKYGKVPILYMPTKKMVTKPKDPGLRHFIQQATSVEEVNNLLNRGKTEYKKVSVGTIRKWENAAAQRNSELRKVEVKKPKLKKVTKS